MTKIASTFPAAAWVVLASMMIHASGASAQEIGETPWGQTPDGGSVTLYTLSNANGLAAMVTNYGATLVTVRTPDREGRYEDLTLHLDSLEDYLKGHPLFGSVVGRFANRIEGAAFTLDGKRYELTPNAGENHIHGGRRGFQSAVWDAAVQREADRVGVKMTHTSPDGHEGYPGEVTAAVSYVLTNDNELIMGYEAETTKPTHVNLTNHAYWNLAGAGTGDALDHIVTINADFYLPSHPDKIPTGEVRSVEGTPMDLRGPARLDSVIQEVEDQNYDHCYVLNKREPGELSLAARVEHEATGRAMEVYTTQPGVQFYTAKGLRSNLSAGGRPFGPYHGICLETQHFPASPNRPHFPSTVLRPGETYRETTVHRFRVMGQ